MAALPVLADSGFGAPWGVVGWTVLLSAAMYLSVLAATRVSGRRTLSQLSAFDAVTTIAIGTILGSTAISHEISYAEGVAAMLTLFALQIVVGLLRQRSSAARRLLDFAPVTVVSDGKIDLPSGPFGSQLTVDEVRSELRHHGYADPARVACAVLEPMGGLSVPERARDERASARSADEVLRDHLRRSCDGDLEGDLTTNFADDVVLLSAEGVHRGHEGVRALADVLRTYVADGTYEYEQLLVDGELGLLRWSAGDGGTEIHDGVDTFVVRGGLIVAQTIHFSVTTYR